MRLSGVLAIAAAGALASAAWAEDAPVRTASGEGAAVLSYIMSQQSPSLSRQERTAISQDFNGAPLAGQPTHHRVTARSVSCRARNISLGKASPRCTIDFGGARSVEVHGPDSDRLFAALGELGAEDDPGMGHIVRTLRDLICTVDDKAAQSIPSSGDNVAGFSCRFRPDQ